MAAQRRRAVAVLRSAVLALGLALLVAACRVDTSVHVEVEDAGSGTVTVVLNADAVAVARVPELAGGLRLDDARAAGWAVEGPLFRADGGVQIRAVKRFESSAQLPQLLEEFAGPDVIFTDVVLEQTRSFAETSYRFQADVDPTPPLDTFSDSALAAIFEGQPFGRPLQDLIAEAGTPEDSLGFEFSLTLLDADEDFGASSAALGAEGDLEDEMAELSPQVDGSTATWRFSYGDRPVTVNASTMITDTLAPLWLNIARVAGTVFGAVLLGVGVAKLVALLRAPRGRGRRATRRRQQRAAAREAEASRPRKRLLRLLVMDVHGVIVRPTDPREGLLLPVILGENPDIDPELIRDRHRMLVLGRLTAEEFWSDLGLGPIGRDVETRYLSSFKLVPGLHPFLDRVASRSLPVAAVGNQPREWGLRLRRMAELEDSVSSWMVSGAVGAVLPERPLFEATRRVMSVDLYDCLYLSSVPEYLDAASEMGMATGYFAASPEDVQETEHTLIRGYDDILKGRSAGT
jgi:FMN phosphatase YigB (HAD superfamily)